MSEELSVTAHEVALTPVHLSARDVPPPSTISPEARQALSDFAATPRVPWPSPDDREAWLTRAAESNAMWDDLAGPILEKLPATVETVSIGGVTCHECRPTSGVSECSPVYMFMHGGAFFSGGGSYAKVLGARDAAAIGIRVISVDYRLAPDHRFPAALEDCVAVYRALAKSVPPSRLVIGGSSAGGNLAAAATLAIRDRDLPTPSGVVLLSPELDLTESGDSFRTNADLDVILKFSLDECNALYAGDRDLTDPYLSPLFADFTKGFPPALIQSGTRDLFLSNAVRMHRKLREAGLEAELHVWEAMPHGAFSRGDAPEHDEIAAEVGRFIHKVVKAQDARQDLQA